MAKIGNADRHPGQGICQRLIETGITRLRERSATLVFNYGDPKFYSKVEQW